MSTDKDWERWGKENPYYGVYTNEMFIGKALDKEVEQEFYTSGKRDVGKLVKKIEKLYGKKKRFARAVDFGSGVGRLSFALIDIAKEVTGLDISPSMVKIARMQARNKAIKNVTFSVTDGSLKGLPKQYDLVYSYIVFQHIPPRRGMLLIEQLAQGLAADGCLALQVTFGLKRSRMRRGLLFVRENVAPVRWAANVLKRRPIFTPNMRMHSYSLNAIFDRLGDCGISDINVEFTNHGGFVGAFIIGRKTK